MGCDIHCYIEYKKNTRNGWSDFGGRINPGRNYWMFGAMAGVRSDDIPHVEPRGLPSDLGYSAHDDAFLFIVEKRSEERGYCTIEQAESYMKYGSKLIDPDKPLLHNRIEDPDWHTHSWLTVDEFELSLATYLKHSGFQIGQLQLAAPAAASELVAQSPENSESAYALNAITEYWAILQAMRCFEAQGHAARLVFWFDN